jgi:hypothetical protein
MEDKRCRRSIRMERFPVVDRQKGTSNIRETSAGLIEIREEELQRRFGGAGGYSRHS